ncbi:MAG: ABC transporter substrate-binding protein [Deltaproteobacteria bacterium]
MKCTRSVRLLLLPLLALYLGLCGCSGSSTGEGGSITVVDQLGRTVIVPEKIRRIAALHHFGGKVVFALGQQEKLVDQALYHRETVAMARVNPSFAAKPKLLQGHGINNEDLIALKPDITIAYVSFDPSQLEQLENAGIRVVAIRGETLEESYEGVRLVAKVLRCEKRGEEYIADCKRLIQMVKERTAGIPPEKRLKVMFAGPKNIYTAATGQMTQNVLLETAGGRNVASPLTGFWASVSPEQIVAWDPDVIFLGSSLDTYGAGAIFSNQQFQTIKAVKNRKVYVFPSNIGWWDYPAPHCVLGTVWAAKMLYPDKFRDLDMVRIADEFYKKYMGYTFTEMGGRL